MKSLTKHDIIKQTAQRLNMDPAIVESAVNSYYKYIHQRLSNANELHVKVTGLGTFSVIKSKVENHLKRQRKIVNMLNAADSPSMARYETRVNAQRKLDHLEDLLEKVEQEQLEKEQFKEDRDDK